MKMIDLQILWMLWPLATALLWWWWCSPIGSRYTEFSKSGSCLKSFVFVWHYAFGMNIIGSVSFPNNETLEKKLFNADTAANGWKT